MVRRKYTLIGAEALLGSAFFYALTAVLIRYMAPMWGDKAQVAVRWLLAFIILVLYVAYKKKRFVVPRRKLGLLAAMSISFILLVLFFTAGVQNTTVANSLFMYFGMTLVFSFIFGTIFLKENINKTKTISFLLALFGLIFFAGDFLDGSKGIILSAISGVFGATIPVFYKLLRDVDQLVVLVAQYGIGSFFAILATLISGETIIREASLSVSLLTIVFALVLIAATALSIYGFKHFDVNAGSALTSSEIAFGVILALILFREIPSLHELAGGLLILAGAVIGSLDFKLLKDSGKLA